MRLIVVFAALALTPVSVLAQSSPAVSATSTPAIAGGPNISATLKASPQFSILDKALDDTKISGILTSTPGLTLFAPTDAAFKALPSAQLAALLDPQNLGVLQKVLTYHLVHLTLSTAQFKGSKGAVASVETSSLQLDGSGATPKVNNADIVQPDIHTGNGDVIQVVDKVLLPPDVTIPVLSASAGAPGSAGR
jgi:uncharacterized surface protein with fasciclin (FAS1) repeats